MIRLYLTSEDVRLIALFPITRRQVDSCCEEQTLRTDFSLLLYGTRISDYLPWCSFQSHTFFLFLPQSCPYDVQIKASCIAKYFILSLSHMWKRDLFFINYNSLLMYPHNLAGQTPHSPSVHGWLRAIWYCWWGRHEPDSNLWHLYICGVALWPVLIYKGKGFNKHAGVFPWPVCLSALSSFNGWLWAG